MKFNMEVKTRNNLSVSPDIPLWPAKLKRTPIYLPIPPINNQRKVVECLAAPKNYAIINPWNGVWYRLLCIANKSDKKNILISATSCSIDQANLISNWLLFNANTIKYQLSSLNIYPQSRIKQGLIWQLQYKTNMFLGIWNQWAETLPPSSGIASDFKT